ncbi:bone morphogenetic protein receptor type-2-like [Cololabis saira]|uniref:bone morphogenetic protein receptor type-2-like n=1 Tax=Cololabis saira TaxID=129043 RepID=UPI002AD4D436|nr:bone morphogenetic protein receptor type-2-like [Cololabis saira]
MQWLLVFVVQYLFICISKQSVFQKRQCIFQVTHPKNYRYTAGGNVSGSVQICENTLCCVGIYLISDGQPKVDTLACDMVETFCPDATCKAHQSLKNRFIRCVCSTDLCNSNITWNPEAELPPYVPSYSTAGTMKTALVVILPVVCFIILATKWRSFRKEKEKDLQSSCHDYSIQPLCSCQTNTSENYITDIDLQQAVGQGHFATVFQGKYKGSVVAVKIYPAAWRQTFTKEKEIYELPLMKHNGIAQFIGTGQKPEDNSWFIVLQHADYGSLYSFLCKHTTTWMQSLKLCQSLSQGLSYLHSDLRSNDVHKPPVAHRDLSSSNVLVKADGTCALCDFGCSTVLRSCSGHRLWQHQTKNMKGHDLFGTLHYMSPEILEGSVNLSSNSYLMHGDVYALSLVLWEIWMRCSDLFEGGIAPQHLLPYELELEANVTLERLIFYVSEMDKRPSIPESWERRPQGSLLKELLTDCWDRDADARLTAPCVVDRLSPFSLM